MFRFLGGWKKFSVVLQEGEFRMFSFFPFGKLLIPRNNSLSLRFEKKLPQSIYNMKGGIFLQFGIEITEKILKKLKANIGININLKEEWDKCTKALSKINWKK